MEMKERIEKTIDEFIAKHKMINSFSNRDSLHDAICISNDNSVVAIHSAAGCDVCGKPKPKPNRLEQLRKNAKVVKADPWKNPE